MTVSVASIQNLLDLKRRHYEVKVGLSHCLQGSSDLRVGVHFLPIEIQWVQSTERCHSTDSHMSHARFANVFQQDHS